MAKPAIKHNPRVAEIFEELDQYLNFCRDYGYRYNEGDLHNFKSYAWQQYSKFAAGKNAKNMWEEDARRLSGAR